nr:hypothetical protein [Bacillus siamensis]
MGFEPVCCLRRRNHSHESLNSNEPPLPGKITYGQAKGFSQYSLSALIDSGD